MSKFSPAQHVTDRLGDALLEHEKATLAPDTEMSAEEIAALPAEMFDRAAYNEQAATPIIPIGAPPCACS